MKDKRDETLDKLFQTVRAMKPDTVAVEEYFETRLLARIEEKRSNRAAWSIWSWRLIPVFSAIVIIIGLGSILIDPARSNDPFASFTNGYDEYLATSSLVGG
jgi:hypothetical protein